MVAHSPLDGLYALILASPDRTPPDPVYQAGARKVYGGKLPHRIAGQFAAAKWAYPLMDLDSDSLIDHETVWYHIYELHADGTYGPPLSLPCTPSCTRQAAVTIARDAIKKRLRYHMRRANEEGIVTGPTVPVLEQEVRVEGATLPAVYVKERVVPNPNGDTVGHQAGDFKDAHNPLGIRQFRFHYSATVSVLILTDNPDTRTDLEAFIRGALDADRELWAGLGLENPQLSAFTRHDVDESGATNLYASEISLSCGITTRITETITQLRPALVKR